MRAARTVLLALLPLLVVLLGAMRAPLQGGYTTREFRQHGLKLPVARSYDPAPIQPQEEWIVLHWAENRPRDERGRRPPGGEFSVARIDYEPDPAPVTGGGSEVEAPEPRPDTPDEGGGEGEDPEAEPHEPPPPPPPLNSFERYMERELSKWEARPTGEERTYRDWEGAEYLLRPAEGNKTSRRGWVWVWRKERERTLCFIGFALEDRFEEQLEIWRYMAEKARLEDPDTSAFDKEVERWGRYYQRKGFVAPEYRTKVRMNLDEGWEAEDTEHYIAIYNVDNQPLVRKILRDLEYIREKYVELFPPAGEISAVSTVRVCADRAEYLRFSGLPSSAGYWSSSSEELVLYDGTKREKGKRTDTSDVFIVLYHEAFHQYIHYSAGELSPHSWFNEGYGDFFSGAKISGGKVRKIDVNPWRIHTIQRAIEQGKHVPWSEILRYEQKDYYKNAGLCYAQGWSMIYFLNTSKEVQRDGRLAAILPTYFDVLKASWAAERAQLLASGKDEDDAALDEARLRARTAAVDAAFEGVDLDALEAAWKEYVTAL